MPSRIVGHPGPAVPFLDPDDVCALVGDQTTGEETLDLRGASADDARIAIASILERRRTPASATLVIRIDPASATSGETLFIPVGRQLLNARKRGLVSRFHPLPGADGGGFYVELPGYPTAARGD